MNCIYAGGSLDIRPGWKKGVGKNLELSTEIKRSLDA